MLTFANKLEIKKIMHARQDYVRRSRFTCAYVISAPVSWTRAWFKACAKSNAESIYN